MTNVFRVTHDRTSGLWFVTQDGHAMTLAKYATRNGAVSLAQRIARTYEPSKLVVHHVDGRVEREQLFREATLV